MVFDKLSNHEKQMIEQYIERYGQYGEAEHMAAANNRGELRYVLRHWNREKEDLFQLFGGEELILTKHVHLEADVRAIMTNLENMQRSDKTLRGVTYANIFMRFTRWFREVCRQHGHFMDDYWEQHHANRWAVRQMWLDSSLIDTENLARNSYDGDACTLFLPDTDKPYQVKHGMRLTRILERIRKAYENLGFSADDMAQIQDLLAMARSTANSDLDLCLSIHPLDYMTMSDNAMGWTSCMGWMDHEGDYRQGTVECMNSPTVVVAYVRNKDDMSLGLAMDDTDKWANKAWRELFIVDRNMIIADKGYPFQHEALVEVVLDWLKDLASKNWGVNFDLSAYLLDNCGKLVDKDENDIAINGCAIAPNVHWNWMYDDLGTLARHCVRVNSEEFKDLDAASFAYSSYQYFINGSGESECMWCGGELTSGDGDDEEYIASRVMCDCCAPADGCNCAYCGDRYHMNQLNYIEDLDAYVCEDCCNEHIVEDDISGAQIWDEDSRNLYVAVGRRKSNNEIITLPEPFIIKRGSRWDGIIYTKEERAQWFKDPEFTATLISWQYTYSISNENTVFAPELTEEAFSTIIHRNIWKWDGTMRSALPAIEQELMRRDILDTTDGLVPFTEEEIAALKKDMVYNEKLVQYDKYTEVDDNNITRRMVWSF